MYLLVLEWHHCESTEENGVAAGFLANKNFKTHVTG